MPRPPVPPSKLTPEVQKEICSWVRQGGYTQTAAAKAGIDRETYRRWFLRGKKETSGPYREFYLAVRTARAEAELAMIGVITGAAKKGDWKAAEARLRLTNPGRFGDRMLVRVEKVQRELEGKLDKLREILTPELYERVLEIFAVEDDTHALPRRGDRAQAARG